MVKHNNAISNEHFRKHWQERVKTWFQQPIQKKIRRQKRMEKAAAIAPRPASGPLRPYVQSQTQKYNCKSRVGRGFTLEELKAAGISAAFAKTVGISVDHRRRNKSEESLKINSDRLKEYKERLVVFPRKGGKAKKGDATKEEVAAATQLKGVVVAAPAAAPAVTMVKITSEMKDIKAHYALRDARNEKRLQGPREKKIRDAAKKD